MTKVRFFFSVFCVIQLFICNSKISYADDGGFKNGSATINQNSALTPAPGSEYIKIANMTIGASFPSGDMCEGSSGPCSWQHISIRSGGLIYTSFNMHYKVAKVVAYSPSNTPYNIEVFLIPTSQPQVGYKIKYNSSFNNWQDPYVHPGTIVGEGSSTLPQRPANRGEYTNDVYIPPQALNSNSASNQKFRHRVQCNHPNNGVCLLDLSMRSSPAKYDIMVKLPPNFKESGLRFEGANVLSFNVMTELNSDGYNANGNGLTASLILDGSFSLQETCSFNLSSQEINFGNVEVKSENGELAQQSVVLQSTCTHLGNNTSIAYEIEHPPVNSITELVDENTVSILAYTKGNNRALGLRFGFNDEIINCFGSFSDRRKYNQVYMFKHGNGNLNTKLTFKLCQYGLPASYGEKRKTFGIKVRWVKS